MELQPKTNPMVPFRAFVGDLSHKCHRNTAGNALAILGPSWTWLTRVEGC